MTKELGEPVLLSSKFAELYPAELVSLGPYALRGVAGTHELYALGPASAAGHGIAGEMAPCKAKVGYRTRHRR
jgi:hypothetical protein